MSDSENSESNETRRTVVVPSRQIRTSNRRIRTYTSVQRRDLRSIKAIIEHVKSMITLTKCIGNGFGKFYGK